MYIGKNAFDSLLESQFKEQGHLGDIISPVEITVEDLEDYIEGY